MPLRRVPRIDARVRKRHLLDARRRSLHAHRDFERRRGCANAAADVCVSFSCVHPPSVRADVRQRRRYRSEFLEGLARAPHRDHPDAEVAPRAAAVVVFVASPRSRRRRQKRARGASARANPGASRFPGPAFLSVSSEEASFASSRKRISPPPPPPPPKASTPRRAPSLRETRGTPRVAGERVHLRPQRLGVRLKRARIHPGRADQRRSRGSRPRARHSGTRTRRERRFWPREQPGAFAPSLRGVCRTRARASMMMCMCFFSFSVSQRWMIVSSLVTTRRRSLLRRAAHEPSLVDVSRLSRVLLFLLSLSSAIHAGGSANASLRSASMAVTFS